MDNANKKTDGRTRYQRSAKERQCNGAAKAAREYRAERKAIDDAIAALQARLATWDEAQGKNWGHVGSAGHIASVLAEIVESIDE